VSLYLNVTLSETHITLGSAGTQVRIFMENVFAIEELGTGSKMWLSEPGVGITTIKVTQPIDTWNGLTFNP